MQITEVGRDTVAVVNDVRAAGADVGDIALSGATLQDVFIALTGRELRE